VSFVPFRSPSPPLFSVLLQRRKEIPPGKTCHVFQIDENPFVLDGVYPLRRTLFPNPSKFKYDLHLSSPPSGSGVCIAHLRDLPRRKSADIGKRGLQRRYPFSHEFTCCLFSPLKQQETRSPSEKPPLGMRRPTFPFTLARSPPLPYSLRGERWITFILGRLSPSEQYVHLRV